MILRKITDRSDEEEKKCKYILIVLLLQKRLP